MATMVVHTGDSQRQWIELQRRLRKAADGKVLQRELNRRIQVAGRAALAAAQAGALGVDVTSSGPGGTRGTGLRRRVADATEIKLLGRGIRIRVVARKVDPKYGRGLARSLNNSRGTPWVPPLFGDAAAPFSQQGQNYFEPAIEAHAGDFRKAALDAMRIVADQIKGA